MKPRRAPWTKRELEYLAAHYATTRTADIAAHLARRVSQVSARAYVMGLRKDSATIARMARAEVKDPRPPFQSTKFQPGHVPHNKGQKGWQAGGRARETQYRAGQAPHNARPLGSVRLDKNGLIQVKVADEGYGPRDWRGLHALLWELQHGPIPPGHLVIFADGNRRNFAAPNLLLVSCAENLARNSIHTRYPRELARTINALGQFKRRLREKQDGRPA